MRSSFVLTGAFLMCAAVSLPAQGTAAPAQGTAAAAQGTAAPQPNELTAAAAVAEGGSRSHLADLRSAATRLPMATALGAALALRPRRRGGPPRSAAVVETQIILAIIGALVMLVVGASLARAFGIVGAAGLIRYRAKIDDPKDAGVMLSTLAVGLASGVGLYLVALFAAAFIMGVLWLIESFEPAPYKLFELKVTSKDSAKLQPKVENLLRRQRAPYELRSSSAEEVCYEVKWPMEKGTDTLSNAILALDDTSAVEWDEKKKKSGTT